MSCISFQNNRRDCSASRTQFVFDGLRTNFEKPNDLYYSLFLIIVDNWNIKDIP